ncbi:MAG: aminoglycoside phosphotransferase family protein, partial [Terracoccus sp.]
HPIAVITVPGSFRQMPRWWHDPSGRAWLDLLPSLVTDQCRRWALVIDGDPLHGSNALVVPVRRAGERYVLRISPPGDDLAQEAAALQLWAGRGTVQLVQLDLESQAMLLERLDYTRSLQTHPLSVATPIIAHLVKELAVPAPSGVLSTAAVAAGHVETFEHDWLTSDRPTPRTQLRSSIRLADELARAQPSHLAVNGDLHCEQVLAAERAHWLFVDPVLLRGDREYDFARVLWSRLDELPDGSQITDVFDAFVEAAQVPSERARSWIVVRSMSYLLWGIPRALTRDPPNCRRLLDAFC